MLEILYFDLRIEPAMCTLWVDKAAPTEMVESIEKPLIYSYSTGHQHSNKQAMLIRSLISAKSNTRANLLICFNDGKVG